MNECIKLVEELAEFQKKKLLTLGRTIIPNLTQDDLLQPNDYPELEQHPYFRYEEGLLAGILSTQAALQGYYSGDRKDELFNNEFALNSSIE